MTDPTPATVLAEIEEVIEAWALMAPTTDFHGTDKYMQDLIRCTRTLAAALAALDKLHNELAECHAILRAPSFDNDGGPTDMPDEVRTLLHNNTVLVSELVDERAAHAETKRRLKAALGALERAAEHQGESRAELQSAYSIVRAALAAQEEPHD